MNIYLINWHNTVKYCAVWSLQCRTENMSTLFLSERDNYLELLTILTQRLNYSDDTDFTLHR